MCSLTGLTELFPHTDDDLQVAVSWKSQTIMIFVRCQHFKLLYSVKGYCRQQNGPARALRERLCSARQPQRLPARGHLQHLASSCVPAPDYHLQSETQPPCQKRGGSKAGEARETNQPGRRCPGSPARTVTGQHGHPAPNGYPRSALAVTGRMFELDLCLLSCAMGLR